MGMPQDMAPDKCRAQTRRRRVLNKPMPYRRRARQALKRHSVRDEDLAGRGMSWATVAEIPRERARNPIKQREPYRASRFRAPYVKDTSLPVDVIDPQSEDLSSSHSVRCHRQQHRVVATAELLPDIDCTQQSLNIFPRHGAWGTVV